MEDLKVCQRCGRPSEVFHKHHKIPRSEGGSNDSDNLIEICSNCHFEIHNPQHSNGDPSVFNMEHEAFMKLNIFSEGYGIIPRKISFDPTLSPGAKILYCELSSLCAERGYCWATNAYLAKKFNVSEKTISRQVTELEKYLYIENRGGAGRKIWVHTVMTSPKMSLNIDKNVQVDLDRNDQQNNINYNNKTNNLSSFSKFWTLYPKKVEKKKAESKWNKLTEKDRIAILQDLPKRRESDQWKRGYVPNPMTYLNGERWNDEIPKEPLKSFQKPDYMARPELPNFTRERLQQEAQSAKDKTQREQAEKQLKMLEQLEIKKKGLVKSF